MNSNTISSPPIVRFFLAVIILFLRLVCQYCARKNLTTNKKPPRQRWLINFIYSRFIFSWKVTLWSAGIFNISMAFSAETSRVSIILFMDFKVLFSSPLASPISIPLSSPILSLYNPRRLPSFLHRSLMQTYNLLPPSYVQKGISPIFLAQYRY